MRERSVFGVGAAVAQQGAFLAAFVAVVPAAAAVVIVVIVAFHMNLHTHLGISICSTAIASEWIH